MPKPTNEHARDAAVFKALANPYRLQALELLRGGERCACDLNAAMDLSPSTISHHMKLLVESGIVSARQDGKWVHYSIDEKGAADAVALLARLTEVCPDPGFVSRCCGSGPGAGSGNGPRRAAREGGCCACDERDGPTHPAS